MSFLAPLYLLLLTISIPILLLWFLRQKREPKIVPTIFLWKKAVEEERVSPLLKNLTKSILLLLQLLALLFLTAAAAEAVLNLRLEGRARRVILLVDRSASMGTRDLDGRSRLDRAKEQALTLLGTLRRGDEGMLLSFDVRARILSGFTAEVESLRRLLRGVTAVDLATDPREALRVAAARAATLPPGALEIFLFSDGAFPPLQEPVEGLEEAQFTFVGVGETGENSGIISLNVVAGLEGEARVFPRVANAGDETVRRTLVLLRGESVVDAREMEIPGRSSAVVVFDLSIHEPGPFELRLDPPDLCATDDRAYFVLRDNPVRKVLVVTEGNAVLDRLSDFHPRVEVYAVHPDEVGGGMGEGAGAFDLTIFDGRVPDGLVPGAGNLEPSAVYLDCAPEGTALAERVENPDLVDWNRSHPLNREVDWGEVNVRWASPIVGPPAATVLLEATEGPLAVVLPGPGFALVLGFRLEDSNLPLRLAFPILFANILDRAFAKGRSGEAGYVRSGEVVTRPLPPGAPGAWVKTPGGGRVELSALPDGTASFAATDREGFYLFGVEGAGGFSEPFAVTLTSEAETDIAPRPTVEIGGEPRASDPAALETNLPLRDPFLLAAIAVLLLEWFLWLGGAMRRRRPKAARGGNPWARG